MVLIYINFNSSLLGLRNVFKGNASIEAVPINSNFFVNFNNTLDLISSVELVPHDSNLFKFENFRSWFKAEKVHTVTRNNYVQNSVISPGGGVI
jgi:hypothetical protein